MNPIFPSALISFVATMIFLVILIPLLSGHGRKKKKKKVMVGMGMLVKMVLLASRFSLSVDTFLLVNDIDAVTTVCCRGPRKRLLYGTNSRQNSA